MNYKCQNDTIPNDRVFLEQILFFLLTGGERASLPVSCAFQTTFVPAVRERMCPTL